MVLLWTGQRWRSSCLARCATGLCMLTRQSNWQCDDTGSHGALLFDLADQSWFCDCIGRVLFRDLLRRKCAPPLGALNRRSAQLGRDDYRQLVVFSSLSKRSNVPGLRSGFVAGDAEILKKFLLYRTYHGGAMNPAVQAASIAAWNDEVHVLDNRRLYAEKFSSRHSPHCAPSAMQYSLMQAFILWAKTPIAGH
jgi:N-succinyldiaminopimelate aminotransferase